jgi:hypothetical protein
MMRLLFEKMKHKGCRISFHLNKVTEFQNEQLTNVNRESLPGLCFDIKYNDPKRATFNLTVIFNDKSRRAQSSLINETRYFLKLYQLFPNKNEDVLKANDMQKVNTVLTMSIDKAIRPTDMLEISHLKQGAYLIEVSVESSIYRKILAGMII